MEHGAVITTNAVAGDPNSPSSPYRILILVASIAAGVQFGWALQLSLLTPYVQLLGVPHAWSSFIWLCGPLSGLLVQPTVGYYSDRCTSRLGRRRPYIISGAALVVVAVFLIGFAADIGHRLGDTTEPNHTKPKAVAFFVIGFWILDVANNTLQGPCRALLADLSGSNHSKISAANAFFAFFMAVGNVGGYAAGSYSNLYRHFPFTQTAACDTYCANLKTCFFISIIILITVTTIACSIVKETPVTTEQIKKAEAEMGEENTIFYKQLWTALRGLSKPMWLLFAVTGLNWIGWFPFTLYNTDWMGREIYGGDPQPKDPLTKEISKKLYDDGVSKGSFGLMIYAVTLGVMSLLIEPLARVLGHVKRVWGLGNFVLALCLFLTLAASKMAEKARGGLLKGPPANVQAFVLTIFGILGIPQAVTFSIPFALASIYSQSSGSGQGLSLGLMNISICIPQMFVSLVIGPFDRAFGGGNLPGFVFGAISATLSGIAAFFVLPSKVGES